MNIEANNPLVGYAFAIVATATSILWLWQRINGGSGLLAGLLWLVTIATYVALRIHKTRN
jgi:hypothetical protein